MVDAGKDRKKDICPLEKEVGNLYENPLKGWESVSFEKGCKYAPKCGACPTIAGFGGCLAPYVSAKLCFPPSGQRLLSILGEENVYLSAKKAWNIYCHFAEVNLPYPECDENNDEKQRIKELSELAGFQVFEHPAHVAGEDEMNRFSKNIKNYLLNNVDVVLDCKIDLLSDLNWRDSILNVCGNLVSFDKVVLATGRYGHKEMTGFLKSIDMLSEEADYAFGERMIMPKKYLWPIGKHYPDFKLKWENEHFKLRTFCFNGDINGGRLKYMNYGGYTNVDGIVAKDYPGDSFFGEGYGNFALLAKCKSDMPAEMVYRQFHEVMYNLIAGINGVEDYEIAAETMHSAVEVEDVWGKMKTDNGFWVKHNVAVIGDASGIAMGIVSSMIMGVYIAEEMKEA
jgi:uncharacterized FAD-dependent dehydrogenase